MACRVGLVLADSSIVTLGLPEVVADLGTSAQRASWVLASYNLTQLGEAPGLA